MTCDNFHVILSFRIYGVPPTNAFSLIIEYNKDVNDILDTPNIKSVQKDLLFATLKIKFYLEMIL